ncbi:MAG: hypothetical protein KKB39_06040 [Nanoarchaeota archaeon]|nr:hypothetical protein [Nanoarchaeota archaeon]
MPLRVSKNLTYRLEEDGGITGKGSELSKNIGRKILSVTKKIELPNEEEKKMRWKRTATQILKDGWVVKGKSCTDITVLFIAVAKAKGIKAIFVKLYSIKRQMLHAAVELPGENSILDATTGRRDNSSNEILFDEYKVYKKGRDSWDIGLSGVEDMPSVMEEIGKKIDADKSAKPIIAHK